MEKSAHTKSWRSRLAGAAALAGLALAPGAPAWAQAGGGGSGGGGGTGVEPGGPGAIPREELQVPSGAPVVPAQEPDVLLGDIGGLRSRLVNQGVVLQLDYLAEVAGNVSGQRRGFDYAHQIGFSADIDWGRLAGLTGFNTHFVAINRAGRNLSADYLGDRISQAQEIYGAGFNMGVHLVYFYMEQKLLDDRLNIAAGHWPVGTDFATSTLACIAIALTPGCGHPRVLDNQRAFTNWPQSSFGGRVRGRITPDIYIQTGIWEVVPFPGGGRSGFNWFPGGQSGVTIPVEVGWEPAFGPDRLTGHYKLGYLHDTSTYPDLFYSFAGVPLPLSITGIPQRHQGRDTVYAVVDQMLWRHGPARDQGLMFFANAAYGSTNTIFNSSTAFVSLIDTGIIPSRPNDTIQIAAGWYGIANRVAQLQGLQLQLGQPTFNGVNSPQRNEYVFEASYTAHVFRGITVQPAIQYFVNPNAQTTVKDAVVFAGRLHVNF
jgi:porin